MGRLTASWLAFPGGEILLCRRRQEVWSRTQCGALRTIGVSPLAITISSPAIAASINRDNWVLAW